MQEHTYMIDLYSLKHSIAHKNMQGKMLFLSMFPISPQNHRLLFCSVLSWKSLFVTFIFSLGAFFFLDQGAIACLDREEPE